MDHFCHVTDSIIRYYTRAPVVEQPLTNGSNDGEDDGDGVACVVLSEAFIPDLFGTLDPFGSSTFSSSSSSSNASAGFADFSHMLKPRDPFEGRASWLPDYQKVPKVTTLYWDESPLILSQTPPVLNTARSSVR